MLQEKLVIIILICILCNIFFKNYINIWKKNKPNVPIGCGIILPFVFACINFKEFPIFFLIFMVLVSTIYWIDDLIGLTAKKRIILSTISGVIIFLMNSSLDKSIIIILLLTLFFSFICTGLTNVINFYDGNDLNICFLLFLTGLVGFISSSPSTLSIGIIFLGLSISFGIFNRIPNNLYWGDSGCFSLAFIFTTLLVLSFQEAYIIPSEIFIPLFFPIFDVFFVILIRVHRNHDLLSRNYLHLYQRLNIKFNNKFYLIPQLINLIFVLLMSRFLSILEINSFLTTFISGFLVTPINYLIIRSLLLEKQYRFGDGNIKK